MYAPVACVTSTRLPFPAAYAFMRAGLIRDLKATTEALAKDTAAAMGGCFGYT